MCVIFICVYVQEEKKYFMVEQLSDGPVARRHIEPVVEGAMGTPIDLVYFKPSNQEPNSVMNDRDLMPTKSFFQFSTDS